MILGTHNQLNHQWLAKLMQYMTPDIVKLFFQKSYENYRLYLEDLIKQNKIISNAEKKRVLKRIIRIAEIIKQPLFQ